MTSVICKISGLKKSFGDKEIIKNLNLELSTNKLYGFVGKNGSGKTTTMKMILGLLQKDGGEIIIGGKQVKYLNMSTNNIVGYLPDVPNFYDYLKPLEYLELCGEITNMDKKLIKSRATELISLVGLDDAITKKISSFSRGMKQRLGVAQALLNSPKLLICDEVTSALDPLGRNQILELLNKIKKDCCIIFSTHNISDVEQYCDEIALLDEGIIKEISSVEKLKEKYQDNYFEIEFRNKNDLELFLVNIALDCKYKVIKNRVSFDTSYAELNYEKIMSTIGQLSLYVEKLGFNEKSLESAIFEVLKWNK